MVVCVCTLLALRQDSEVMGFFQPQGVKSEMFGKEERVEESRTEALSGLSGGECEGGEGEMEEERQTPCSSL